MKDIVTEKDELLGVVSPSTQMHTLRFGRRRCYSTLASNRRGLWEGVDVEIEIGTSILQSHHMLGVHLPPQRLASDQLKRGVPCGKFGSGPVVSLALEPSRARLCVVAEPASAGLSSSNPIVIWSDDEHDL